MRVGANVRQYHRIKKMHADGVPPDVIANSIPLTPQSLERILASIDGREVKNLIVEENPQVQAMRIENAELAAKLAKFEEPDDGVQSETETVEIEETIEAGKEVEG